MHHLQEKVQLMLVVLIENAYLLFMLNYKVMLYLYSYLLLIKKMILVVSEKNGRLIPVQ